MIYFLELYFWVFLFCTGCSWLIFCQREVIPAENTVCIMWSSVSMQYAGCGLHQCSVPLNQMQHCTPRVCRVCLFQPPLPFSSPEKSSQSSPLMLSGIPLRTSSFVFSVRYIHTPCPYSVKWFFHACSFMNSFAWAKRGTISWEAVSQVTYNYIKLLTCCLPAVWTNNWH